MGLNSKRNTDNLMRHPETTPNMIPLLRMRSLLSSTACWSNQKLICYDLFQKRISKTQTCLATTLFDSLALRERSGENKQGLILPEIFSFGVLLFRKNVLHFVSPFLNWSAPSVIIIRIPAEANATFIILSHRKLLAHGMSPSHFCTTARIVRIEATISTVNITDALIQL